MSRSQAFSGVTAPAAGSLLPEPKKTTDEQEKLLKDLIAHLEQSDYALPRELKAFKAFQKARPIQRPVQDGSAATVSQVSALKDVELVPLTDREKCWLSREQLLRFCRAVKWKYNDAVLRTEETIIWRRDFGVDQITAESIEEENRTGKELILGFDNQQRPMQHMYPYRQNTATGPQQIKFVVWMLERSVDLMAPGVENLCLAIDFGSDLGIKHNPTPLSQARIVLKILQTYYCERLGRAVCVNVPYAFWLFYKVLGPLIDPVTREKIIFTRESSETRNVVPPEQLEKTRFGGELEFEYSHETYMAELDKWAEERREATFSAWQKQANGKVGYSEDLTRPPHDNVANGHVDGHANGINVANGAENK